MGLVEMTKRVSTERGEAQSRGTPKLRVHRRGEDACSFHPPNYPKMNHCYDPLFTDEKTAGSGEVTY